MLRTQVNVDCTANHETLFLKALLLFVTICTANHEGLYLKALLLLNTDY